MNDVTVVVKVCQPEESVESDFFDEPQRHSLFIEFVMLNDIQ